MIICPWKDIRRYIGCVPGLEEAIETVENLKNMDPATYPLSCGKVVVNAPTQTRDGEGRDLEAHRNYLDIQYILEGEEYMGWAPTDSLAVSVAYNEQKDCSMHSGACEFIHIPAGVCYIVFPEDAHLPQVHLNGKQTEERKILVKLKV